MYKKFADKITLLLSKNRPGGKIDIFPSHPEVLSSPAGCVIVGDCRELCRSIVHHESRIILTHHRLQSPPGRSMDAGGRVHELTSIDWSVVLG